MAEKDEGKNKDDKKEPPVVSLSLAMGQLKNRQLPVTAFVSLGRRELAGKTVYFYIGQDYRQTATSTSGADGRAGALIDIPADIKGSALISAKAEGMALPTSITVDIPEDAKKQTAQIKRLSIEDTWQGYDQYGNSKYQWIPRLFDENNKSVMGTISISTESPIKINDGISEVEGTKFDREIPEKEVKIYKIIISSMGTLEVDVFVHGCDIKREFRLRGKKEVRDLGAPPTNEDGWWKKFRYGLKGGKQ